MDSYGVWKPDGADWDWSTDVWEWQQGPRLAFGQLAEHLGRLDPDLGLLVTIEDGSGDHPLFVPVELGYIGPGDEAPTVLLTGALISPA